MQGSAVSRTLDALPGVSELLRLRTGGAYVVESHSLVMAMMSGPSQAGEWCAVVGAPDFGLEAAAAFGVELERTVVVPRPGEHWLSVTAGMLDVATVVVVRPPVVIGNHQAERLRSRLRQKDAVLLSLGHWPRADAVVSITESSWVGLGRGHGRLSARRVLVSVSEGGPVRQVPLWLPNIEQVVAVQEQPTMPLVAVRVAG
jgi:hypothetical protein